MNIKELNGNAIKKALSANRVHFQYHNKNTRGGNFCINIRGLFGNDWDLAGDYDVTGEIESLRFGKIWSRGVVVRMSEITFEDLMRSIIEITSKVQEMEIKKAVA